MRARKESITSNMGKQLTPNANRGQRKEHSNKKNTQKITGISKCLSRKKLNVNGMPQFTNRCRLAD